MCPKCDSTVSSVRIADVTIYGPGTGWRGIKYVCPSCGYVLSVAIDPVALKTDIVEELLHALRKD